MIDVRVVVPANLYVSRRIAVARGEGVQVLEGISTSADASLVIGDTLKLSETGVLPVFVAVRTWDPGSEPLSNPNDTVEGTN